MEAIIVSQEMKNLGRQAALEAFKALLNRKDEPIDRMTYRTGQPVNMDGSLSMYAAMLGYQFMLDCIAIENSNFSQLCHE